ncbi:MAG: histidine--tRNA ligase [Clostridia bacterium]|jgi:histidyl-tRNA synthetase|nr:histidine--tRNA ligase [Clostridia bacterium]MCI2000824.1 histidine--tRNA ligase [Clostridia bacterium]MCI2015384.1 histidine--tRNA ligase [Clostridia bacterium]
MLTQAPKGTKDIFGAEMPLWQQTEALMRKICGDFGIEEIRTPIFEHTELFLRSVGDTTDIVQKEMYTFNDKAGRSITLRPESTAGVARAYIEHGMFNDAQPTKLFYIAPTFRYENTQAGRQRQFHQFGIEMFGSYSPALDAEVISVAAHLMESLGVKDIELRINSLGGPECRKRYNQKLKEFIGKNIDGLCKECKSRYEKNPLRVLDCKEEGCKRIIADAPSVIDCLGPECREHFEKLQEILTNMGIKFVVDPMIVRGLDYYTRTVFEFVTTSIGAQSTVCGGGRYDNLIEQCGGPKTGAVGFGLGMERLLLTLQAQNGEAQYKPYRDIFIGSIGQKGFVKSQAITYELRKQGIKAECDTVGRSVKAQMKYANKIGAAYSMIIGDDEIEKDCANLKNMAEGESKEIKLSLLAEEIKKDLAK